VASYSAVYGSVAALPLFIAWVQLSWNIFLFGAEIAHASENTETYGFTPGHAHLTAYSRQTVLVRIMHALSRRFIDGEPPPGARTLSRQLELPHQLVQDNLRLLASVELVSETPDRHSGRMAYQPAKDPATLTVFAVLDAVRRQGRELPENCSTDAGKVSITLGSLQEGERLSSGNVSLKDL
jgi:membrane protein